MMSQWWARWHGNLWSVGKKKKSKRGQPKRKVLAPDFPLFESTDFDDPDSHAAWVFAGLPHMKGAPLGFPMFLVRALSRRLWDCGFRFHPELRTIKYRRPHAGMGESMFTSAGEWVPVDDPDPVPDDPGSDGPGPLAGLPADVQQQVVHALGLSAGPGGGTGCDDRVPYRKADGSTVMVTPAQARQYANAKKARREARS